jgi:hypothetical protein
MVEQVKDWCEMAFAPALPFKLGKIQTAEVRSIDPAVTRLVSCNRFAAIDAVRLPSTIA